jgi:hypothetical protein
VKDSRKIDGTSVEDMERLQDLILGEEKDRLHKLDHRISDLESRTSDIAEVLPAAMSRVAADPASRPDFERPVVNTIRSAIKRDADSFAEALFPVLGPAIRRAVADALRSMVQRINVALENSFTIKGLRWRIESARTGVPFAQIVLRHTMLYAVQEAFLIQRGSGLVLAKVQRDETLTLDEDAVASMLTAIQSFIQDSFGESGDEPLRSAELGNRTLWVINGPVAVLACVITGIPPSPVRDELLDLLETMHARFGSEFHGNPEKLDNNAGLASLMNETLREEADEAVESSKRAKNMLVWGVGILLLVAYLAYSGFNAYRDRQFMEKVEGVFKAQPGYLVTESSMQNHVLNLSGLQDPLASSVSQLFEANEIPPEKVDFDFSPYQSLETDIVTSRIRRQLELDESVGLNLSGANLQVDGMLRRGQLESLAELPQQHLLIQNVNLDAARLVAEEASALLRESLAAPAGVNFIPSGNQMTVSGSSSAQWFVQASSSDTYTGGWLLNFAPLKASLQSRLGELVTGLHGVTFLFSDGVSLRDESESLIADIAQDLAELQQIAAATDSGLSITFEGMGDGIGTPEKNIQVARNRSDALLDEFDTHGVLPGEIIHTLGPWAEGGLNLDRRKVTILIQGETSQ